MTESTGTGTGTGASGRRGIARYLPGCGGPRGLLGTGVAILTALLSACAGARHSTGEPAADSPAPPTAPPAPTAPTPTGDLRILVANESSDVVSELVYTPGGELRLVEDVEVGIMPADIDGAHGLRIAPDGEYWYLTLAHGTPWGKLWKFRTGSNEFVGEVDLGLFPATMDVTPGGELLFVVNFNLHGDPVPSSVSIVHAPTMTELARPTTCVMPHGSRVNAAGTKHYSVCMHSDQLVEIDTRTLEVSRRFDLTPGHERTLPLDDDGGMAGDHAMHAAASSTVCSPTWATPGAGERASRYVYVPCNKNAEVLEIDLEREVVSRRFPTGRAPYNLAVTPDGGLLVASLKGDQAVAVFDLEQGTEVARVPTTRPITHGVAIDASGRYAFISNEAVGSTPSTVDVIDLRSMERVASAETHYQAGGIDVMPAR